MRSMYRVKEQLNIQVGEACIAMRASDTFVMSRLMSLYSDFACDNQPDIIVEFDVSENMGLYEMKRLHRMQNAGFNHKDGSFYFSDRAVSGEYNLLSRTVRIRIEKQVLIQKIERYYLNHLMCLLYNSCNYINDKNRFNSQIVHSSAISRNGRSILFTGPSGIGKTTIAQMCSNHENTVIINDEGNLVSKPSLAGTQISVQGIPIIGNLAEKLNQVTPLICILLLKQSNTTKLRLLGKTEAFKRLMFQVAANIYFGQNDMKTIITSKADFCEEIIRHIPCYELEFTLNSRLLCNTLDSLQKSLVSGSNVLCLAN